MTDDDDIGLIDAFPKHCGCGRIYTRHDWRKLPYVGVMIDEPNDLELRNCVCGSTLSMPIDMACAPTQRPTY